MGVLDRREWGRGKGNKGSGNSGFTVGLSYTFIDFVNSHIYVSINNKIQIGQISGRRVA